MWSESKNQCYKLSLTFVYSLLKCLNVFSDPEKVAAWAEARTGFPWIDAIMTQLRDTFSSQQMIDITREQIYK